MYIAYAIQYIYVYCSFSTSSDLHILNQKDVQLERCWENIINHIRENIYTNSSPFGSNRFSVLNFMTHTHTPYVAKEIKYNELDSIQKAEKTLEQAEQTIINIISFIVFISSFFFLLSSCSIRRNWFTSFLHRCYCYWKNNQTKPNQEKMKRLCIQVLDWLTLACYFY